MKKILFTIVFLAAALMFAKAQDPIPVEATVEFNKTQVPGISLLLSSYSIDVVQGAISARFETLKSSKAKGCYKAYVSQRFSDFSSMNIDIYVFAETRGKNSKDLVTLSIAISKGNNNFATADNDPEIYQNVKNFLTDFNRYLFEYNVKLQIADENLKIQNLLKDISKLTGEATKLRKNIAETE
ncbi:MAG: hypothetical protein LBV75_06660, partial [Paludibacter sp.]|nr:hypothetical protein [Paludibacter sp.]